MAYDEGTAERVRGALAERAVTDELHMFGGLAFMLGGHMCCGIIKDELMVRLPAAMTTEILAQPHARQLDFTGRPMTGMFIVGADGFADDDRLAYWVDQAVAYAASLPPKPPRAPKPRVNQRQHARSAGR